VYHIEHSAGSGWTPEGEQLLNRRMAERGIPVLEWSQVKRWITDMHELHCPLIFNGPDWGLGGEDLPETVIGAPAARRADWGAVGLDARPPPLVCSVRRHGCRRPNRRAGGEGTWTSAWSDWASSAARWRRASRPRDTGWSAWT